MKQVLSTPAHPRNLPLKRILRTYRQLTLATVLVVASGWISFANATQVFLVPDCPVASSSISVVVQQAPPGLGLLIGEAAVTRAGSSIRVVIPVDSVGYGVPPPPGSREYLLGSLPSGSYHLDVVGRYGDGVEEALANRDFQVTETVRCGSLAIVEATRGGFQTAHPDQAFVDPLEVVVLDAERRPIEGETVLLQRLFTDRGPDVLPSALSAVSGADGVARFSAVAGRTDGSVTYQAVVFRRRREIKAYFVLSVRPQGATSAVEPAVEYVNTRLFHFFITSNPDEMRRLDVGELPDWVRTGGVFLVYPRGATTGNAVCRYYGLPSAGIDSHFFSASKQECDEVAVKFPKSWTLETSEAFRVELPDPLYGQCIGDFFPVFRTFNQRADANHRYTTDYEVSRIFSGWVSEGYGPHGVVMCSPK